MFGRKPKEPETTLAKSWSELQFKTQANNTWGLGDAERWDADQDAGEVWFTLKDGRIARAPLQVVGSYSYEDNSWMWAWEHPSIDVRLSQHAKLCRAFGTRHGLIAYKERHFQCTEVEAWRFMALAAHLGNAVGAYAGRGGVNRLFMTFGRVIFQGVN